MRDFWSTKDDFGCLKVVLELFMQLVIIPQGMTSELSEASSQFPQ